MIVMRWTKMAAHMPVPYTHVLISSSMSWLASFTASNLANHQDVMFWLIQATSTQTAGLVCHCICLGWLYTHHLICNSSPGINWCSKSAGMFETWQVIPRCKRCSRQSSLCIACTGGYCSALVGALSTRIALLYWRGIMWESNSLFQPRFGTCWHLSLAEYSTGCWENRNGQQETASRSM